MVVRDRLLAELDRHSSKPLTLVAAPVGFGKTVLAQSWCAHTGSAVAWLSLGTEDDDPTRLWSYLATSVDRVRSGLGRMALRRLCVPGVPTEVAVDELINGISAYGEPLAIVLDDLHLVRDDACLRSLERAIEHLPANARIIATSRSDPGLSLGRLRAGGRLGEVRAQALAFTVDEARQLLVREGLAQLDDASVEMLVERTEGWVAGLYLAALWLRGLDDPAAGVRDFHGSHRHVVDYLSGEVLDRLDADTRRFLLETSVLGRFNAPLCDWALGRSDSSRRLRETERANGFLIALDAQGEWYRYHQLFADLLRLELAQVEPEAATRLHQRASDWFREQGLVGEALEHAAAACDEERLVSILVESHRALLVAGRLETVLHWVARLPDLRLVEHPELPIAAAIAGMLAGASEERRRLIALAERARAGSPERWAPYHEVMLGIAVTGCVEEDVGAAIERVRSAAELARESVPEEAAPALAGLGHLLFLAGNLDEARTALEEALVRPEIATRPHGHVHALAALSLVHDELGEPEAAEAQARRAVAVAKEAGLAETASGGMAFIALANALAARARLRDAEQAALRGERLRRQSRPEAGHLHALLVLAGIRARRGNLVGATSDLERARRGLGAFSDPGRLPELAAGVEELIGQASASNVPLGDPPSEAEMMVLRMLPSDLSLREIGAELFLSLNTVKTHTRSLYRRLGVSSRAGAVVRATALGLLDLCDSPG